MCGICGIYGTGDKKLIEKMTTSINHRGPDASYHKTVDNRHSLGGARLRITGEWNVPFPYSHDSSEVQVLLNGEIYNYRYWRNQLEQEGFSFFTDTDTEVVWAMYRKFGPEFVRHLKGMFAIAVLDGDKLVLIRDSFGIKPLYYWRKDGNLAFSSEIKALLRYPKIRSELKLSALQEIYTFGYIFSPVDTLFEGIKQVKPGEILEFDGHKLTSTSYFSPREAFSSPSQAFDLKENTACLEETLKRNMKIILEHGEYEPGVFLSGGVDSSLMAVLAKEVNGSIKTFTLADNPEAPDRAWARRVAEAIESEHYEFNVTLQDYLEELPRFVYHYENVVAGGVFDLQGGIAFQLLCKEASKHVRVALTGEGADELFGGYYWTYTHPLGFADRLRTRCKQVTSIIPNEELEEIVNTLFPLPEDEKTYRLNIFDALLKGGLSNYHLWSVDRSSGAFGFEIRPYYLYDDTVELALNLPVELKAPAKGFTKVLLKEVAKNIFAKYGLEDVAERQKYGMPAALNSLDSRVRRYIEEHLNDKHLEKHPYKAILTNKVDVFMFDLFYYIFFCNQGQFNPDFKLEEALAGGIFEGMYS